MKVKKLIEKLQEFDDELEVTITDGFAGLCYHTNNIDIQLFEEDGNSNCEMTVDIGIGGNRIN